MTKKILLAASTALLVMVSCRPIKPSGPNLPIDSLRVEPLPPSNIDVPITLDLTSTFAELNANIPSEIYSDNWPNMQGSGNCQVEYKWFFRRTPLAISLAGQTINVSSTGYYGAEARARPCCGWLCPWFGVSCGTKNLKELTPALLKYGYKKATLDSLEKYLGEQDEIVSTDNKEFNKKVLSSKENREPPRQIVIALSSTVSLLNNYQLYTSTLLTQFEPVNRCKITFLSIDITDRILEKARPKIADALRTFDEKMAHNNFRSKVEPVWNKLFEPIALGSIGFLTLNPEQVRLSSLNGSGNKVDFSVGLTARPVFTLTDSGSTPPTPLPDISSSTPGNGFNVYVDGKLEYAPLSVIINQQIDTVGNIPIDNGGYINLSNAEVFGVGNSKLLVKVNVKGRVRRIRYKGWLYLSGTPTYNASTGELTLTDLDYTLETRNVLLSVANWLLNSSVKEILQERAKWNITTTLENLRQELNNAVNRQLSEDVSLEGEVTTLNIVGFQAIRDYLLLRANTAGQVSVRLK